MNASGRVWFWIDLGSAWRGLRAMRRDRDRASVNITLRVEPRGNSAWGAHLWTPVWHQGRGPYLIIRLGRIGFYRAY
jgi:hypothetical protein